MNDPFESIAARPSFPEPANPDMSSVRRAGEGLTSPKKWRVDTSPALTREEIAAIPEILLHGDHVACRCSCGCDNDTSITLEDLSKSSRARFAAESALCDECKAQKHGLIPNPEEDALLIEASLEEGKLQGYEKAREKWFARVPNKFRHADMTEDEFILDRVERFAQGVPSGFIVSGSYGTGKTWMAFGFLNILVERGLVHPSEILFGSENELLGIISMGTFAEQEEARRRLLDPKYKIVYVDDVGQGNFRSARDAHSIWNQFVDGIWSTDRSLIVSTNYSLSAPAQMPGAERQPSQFEQWVGGAAMDRLGGVSGYAVQVMGAGEDANHRRLNSLKIEQAWRDQSENRQHHAS